MFDFTVPKHKVFISFHHDDDDYRKKFETLIDSISVNRSVQDGDIDPNYKTETIRQSIRDRHISDTTVTIVLIGPNTWRRKHVDWEIGYSLTNTNQNNRSGLIGILLPNYEPHFRSSFLLNCETHFTQDHKIYTPCNIPPRLYDNIQNGYARIYSFPRSKMDLKQWVHEAYLRRKSHNPNNNRAYYSNNRNQSSHWVD